jgi:hypothetical protein
MLTFKCPHPNFLNLSPTKIYTFGGTVPSIYDAGTLSAGDDRITVPASVTVPANGSTTMTVTANGGHALGEVAQGWINLDGPGSNDLHLAYYAIVGY